MRNDMDIWVDWAKLILNLRRKGWTHDRIAKKIGVGQTSVSQWARSNNEPKLNPAIRLLDLHLDECPERHQELI